jgi:hypothetical protein
MRGRGQELQFKRILVRAGPCAVMGIVLIAGVVRFTGHAALQLRALLWNVGRVYWGPQDC